LCITTEWTPDDEYGSKVRITALQKQEPIQLKRARAVAARSPVRLDFELLREATALTAIRDLEELFITLSTRRFMRHRERF
jgi:hypothetical protein